MRVTSNTFPDSLVNQLANLTLRQNRLQDMAASGQRVRLLEDDPIAMQRVLNLQTEAKSVAQYQRNASTLRAQAQATYEVMRGLKKVSDRAGELAVLADGTKSPDQLKIYANEVTQLIKQAVQTANGKFRSDYLLSGTRSDQAPFVMTTDADGLVTSVTYQGNSSVALAEVADGLTLSAQSVGANSTGSGPRGLITDSRSGADFFNHLISLQNNLLAGNTAAIASSDLPQLGKDEENLALSVGENGIVQSRLDMATEAASQRALSLEGLVSNEADADLTQTLVRLNQTQTAYQAALQSGTRLLSTSLLDYLR
jgi:flagellar hook-associated protein 3 FlgL